MNNLMIKLIRSYFPENLISFLKHSKNYFTANIFLKGLAIITIPIFTRLMSTSDYGILSIFSTVVSVLIVISSLATEESIRRYYFEETDDFDESASSMFYFATIFSTIILFFSFVFAKFLSEFFVIPQNVFIYSMIIAYFTFPFSVYMAILNSSENSRKFSNVSIIKGLMITGLSITFIYVVNDEKYLGVIYGMLLGEFLLLFYIIYSLKKRIKLNFSLNIKYLKYFIFYSLPLIPLKLSGIILTMFDSVIIGQLKGVHFTALYAIAYKVGMLLLIVHQALGLSWRPKFFGLMNKKEYETINSFTNFYAKIMFYFAIGLILISDSLIAVLAPKEYMDAIDIVPIIILSYCFLFIYEQFSHISFYYKKTYINTIIMFFGGALNISLNYLLIPEFGYKIAAFTTLISFIFILILYYLNTRILLQERKIIFLNKILPQLCVVIIICIVNYFSLSKLNIIYSVLSKIFLLIVIGYFWFVKYNLKKTD